MYTPIPLDGSLLFDVDSDTVAMVDEDGHCVICQNRDGEEFEDRIICLSPDELHEMIDCLTVLEREWHADMKRRRREGEYHPLVGD